jgi:hypothetical protein
MSSFKVGVKTARDRDWVFNSVRFASREDAQAFGEGLAWRWLAVDQWEVQESEEAPNR